MNKTSLYIVFILSILSSVVYFAEAPQRILGTSTALKNEENSVPFAVVRGTTTTHFAKDGLLSYTFNAPRLEHYREKDDATNIFTLVDKPELVVFQDDEPWFIQAQKGKLSSTNKNIELWNEVHIKYTNAEGVTTTVRTEKLTIDPENKLANTEEPVKIVSDKVELDGIGMNADMATKKLKLLSNVRGLYDPI